MSVVALVLGASPMLGTALGRAIEAHGWRARLTTRVARDGVDALDVADEDAVARAVAACDVVFNLAAVRARTLDLLATATRVNVQGAANVLTAASRAATPPAVVLVGSAEEYGPGTPSPYREDGATTPASPYGATKRAATELARIAAAWLPTVVLRPSVIYGPGQPAYMLVAGAVRAARDGATFPIRGGEQTRDHVYVDDVADAMVRAASLASSSARGRVINVASGTSLTVNEVAQRVMQLAGSGRVDAGPPPTERADVPSAAFDVTLARELLGWRATTPLDEGLRRTLDAAR